MTIENPDDRPAPEPPRADPEPPRSAPEAPRAGGGSVDIAEKFRATSMGERIILVATLVLLIVSFLPWYSVDLGSIDIEGLELGGSVDRNAWQSPGALWSILAVLIGARDVSALSWSSSSPAQVRCRTTSAALPGPRSCWAQGDSPRSLILIKLINESSHLAFGFFIGILCVVALVVGGFFMYREEEGRPIM